MHRGGNGIACFTRPQSLSSFNRRSFLPICSSRAFNMSLMSDQCALGFCVFSSVDSLCVSTISSLKTHSRGRPGFLVCFIELKLSDLRFNSFTWQRHSTRCPVINWLWTCYERVVGAMILVWTQRALEDWRAGLGYRHLLDVLGTWQVVDFLFNIHQVLTIFACALVEGERDSIGGSSWAMGVSIKSL